MPNRQQTSGRSTTVPDRTRSQSKTESLVLRNYDGLCTQMLTVTCRDCDGDVAFDRTVPVDPGETVSIHTHFERGVYRVEVRLDDDTTATAACLIGDDPTECALIETGNGTVSVTDGCC